MKFMKVGDLVRDIEHAQRPELSDSSVPIRLGFVIDVRPSWPNDPYETDLTVTVAYPDGIAEAWYDWQLEVVSETR